MAKEVRTTSSTGGMKAMKEQRTGLVPADVFLEFSEIYGIGAQKYDDNNWRRGYEWSKSIDAGLRHMQQFNAGIDYDLCTCDLGDNAPIYPCPQCGATGKKHVLQAAWHMFTLAWYMDNKPEFDDRAVRFDEKIAEPSPPVHETSPEEVAFLCDGADWKRDYEWITPPQTTGRRYQWRAGMWKFQYLDTTDTERWNYSGENKVHEFGMGTVNGPFIRGKRVN